MNYLQKTAYFHYLYGEDISQHSDSCEKEAVHEIDYAPLPRCVWDLYVHQRNYVLISMQEDFVERAIDFVMDHYVKYDILCRGMHLTRHEDAVEHYKYLIRYWVQDRSSILAIEEGNERIVGILVAKMNYIPPKNNLEPRYSRMNIFNPRVQDIQNLRVRVRQKILDYLCVQVKVRKYLDIKLFCVDRLETDYQDIKRRLISAMEEVAVDLKTKFIIAVISSAREQYYFRKSGYIKSFEVSYKTLIKHHRVTQKKYHLFPTDNEKAKFMGFFKILDPAISNKFESEVVKEEEEVLELSQSEESSEEETEDDNPFNFC